MPNQMPVSAPQLLIALLQIAAVWLYHKMLDMVNLTRFATLHQKLCI